MNYKYSFTHFTVEKAQAQKGFVLPPNNNM